MSIRHSATRRVVELWHPGHVDELDELITDWLDIPTAAEILGTDAKAVRQLLDERQLIAVRRTERNIRSVPADFLADGRIVRGIPGTITLLGDQGFSDIEALRWLFTPDPTLPGSPVERLRAGERGEVRRRAQALGF